MARGDEQPDEIKVKIKDEMQDEIQDAEPDEPPTFPTLTISPVPSNAPPVDHPPCSCDALKVEP